MVSSLARRVLRAEALCHTRWYSQPPPIKLNDATRRDIHTHTHTLDKNGSLIDPLGSESPHMQLD